MKSVVASIGMIAAVANAYQFPQHAHYRRDYNGTDSQTTLTVKTTVVETITSCAPTVTNCPSRDQTAIAQLPESDKTTLTATHTVILTEVVCPVSEASSIYTSVLHDAETGGVTGKTITAEVPMNTGGAYPPPTEKTIVSDYTTDQVVTLTQGEETITTTIHKTIQKTLTVPAGPDVTDDGSKGNGTPEDDTTTTTTKTTTGTITKTIQRVDETGPATGGDNGYSTGKSEGEGDDDGSKGTGNGNDNGSNGGSGNGNGECVPETVTVTAPASTVYVTVVPEAAKTNGADDATVTGKTVEGDDSEDDEDDSAEDEICDTTTTLEATVTVVPYPVNGTAAGGYAKPTGFSRRLR